MSTAAPVRDAAVQRLDRQPGWGLARDERVEPPPEPVDLDDVPDLDAFEPHSLKGRGLVRLARGAERAAGEGAHTRWHHRSRDVGCRAGGDHDLLRLAERERPQPGHKGATVRTLDRGRDAARKVRRPLHGDVVVRLLGGTYRLTDALTLRAADSGGNGYEIVYEAAPGARR